MDDYHFLMEPSFHKATSAVVTVISRRRDRVVLNLGKKTFGSADVGGLPAYPRIVGHEGLRPYRFDEEHAIYEIDDSCPLRVGDVVDFHLGYTPFAVNYFDAYHVVDDGIVIDIWPILPAWTDGPRAPCDARGGRRESMPELMVTSVPGPSADEAPELVVATYWVGVPLDGDIEQRVRDLAGTGSTGTWVTLPTETDRIRRAPWRTGAVGPAGDRSGRRCCGTAGPR